MTLATTVHISDPINAELVFLKVRDIIGIPAEHPFRKCEPWGWRNGERVSSFPGGFDSALDVCHANGARLEHAYDDGPEGPTAYVTVRLDTAYGYRSPDGHSGCGHLHRSIVGQLGAWLDRQGARWWAQDEYSGEWREGVPAPFAEVTT